MVSGGRCRLLDGQLKLAVPVLRSKRKGKLADHGMRKSSRRTGVYHASARDACTRPRCSSRLRLTSPHPQSQSYWGHPCSRRGGSSGYTGVTAFETTLCRKQDLAEQQLEMHPPDLPASWGSSRPYRCRGSAVISDSAPPSPATYLAGLAPLRNQTAFS